MSDKYNFPESTSLAEIATTADDKHPGGISAISRRSSGASTVGLRTAKG
ncbi:hypothetical protein [Novipirellula aureliae]|nr:hypothetical protein [Novipirellula aureliae]